MKSLVISATLIGGLGAVVFMGIVASTVPASAKCMVDEGNGRRTPCEAIYTKKQAAKKTPASKSVPQSAATRTGASPAPAADTGGGRIGAAGGRPGFNGSATLTTSSS